MAERQSIDGDVHHVEPSNLAHLSHYEPFYILSTRLEEAEPASIRSRIANLGVETSTEITRAKTILGKVKTEKRARFELQINGLELQPVDAHTSSTSHSPEFGDGPQPPARKRRRVENAAVASTTQDPDSASHLVVKAEEDEPHASMSQLSFQDNAASPRSSIDTLSDVETASPGEAKVKAVASVRVVQLDWVLESLDKGRLLPIQDYTVFIGQPLEKPAAINSARAATFSPESVKAISSIPAIQETPLRRHKTFQEKARMILKVGRRDRNADAAARDFAGKAFTSSSKLGSQQHNKGRLLHQTTSEHDAPFEIIDMPDWVRKNKIYSCERLTPQTSANQAFIDLLEKIRHARTLTGDEIGVRAYSTSIASIAAFPRLLVSPCEILLLPGCDHRIAGLFEEYQETGTLQAADDADSDTTLRILHTFWNIWGVGAATAREFYYDRGWRDLDDVIEYGWNQLSRLQQIGVKYYDEFMLKMPRSEVDYIASVVIYHAKKLVDEGIECSIVGGYRRGKRQSGDVDLIISHREEHATKHLVHKLVQALEKSGWVTHTLTMTETNSERDQRPVALKSLQSGRGFDTLDKALIVWQDPTWSSKEEDLAADPKVKNPNPHRRVDIIVSPWRTVGCAVLGWTSGTTFQRDMRRYSRKVKGWKFDSSGVRELGSGRWVDLEKWTDPRTRAKTWEEAEKRVFEGLELPWREPQDRNTG